MAIRLEPKRADETRDYRHDWSPFLGADDTIASEETTAEGVTLDSVEIEAGEQSIKFWVSAGADGTTARITHTITTADGRAETEVFVLPIQTDGPVSLAVAKAHLRVTNNDSDALIASYITTAREWVETRSGHILVQRAITQSFSRWAPYLELFYRPVVEITEVAYTDTDDAPQTLADYAQTTGRYPFRIYPDSQPSIAENSTITVTFTAGYQEGEEPQILIQAMLILIAGMYDNRGSIPQETSDTAAALCDKLAAVVI